MSQVIFEAPLEKLQLLADLRRLAAEGLANRSSRWYCNRPGCDGSPHEGWHFCEHPLENHPTGAEYWRCRHARPNQHPPKGDWLYWLIMAGRGFGKTRSGAEWLAECAKRTPETNWAVVAPTRDDLKATCIEGESGLLAALGLSRSDDAYNKSDLVLRLPNGSTIRGLSAERPDRARGPNLAGAWLDELASWRYRSAWDDLFPALRRADARVCITTTPRPVPLVREFTDRTDDTVKITYGSTFDNEANLSPQAIAELRRRWEGTRRARQELYGELLEDVPGALWTISMIEGARATLLEAS